MHVSRAASIPRPVNELGDDDVSVLAAALPQTQLLHLNLYRTLGAHSPNVFRSALTARLVRCAARADNRFGAEGARALAAVLAQTQLTALSLTCSFPRHQAQAQATRL